ncbi:hypothetical protein KAFR_0J02740 [Kazachstania africana CBS 2517]|uniref:Uncharacterized protein n=1 Tax=Kazachstania africana (strain ATCC 22294 / BCRC 22015 / CBS 2517 / CECT 1963 / NBRC 1671 / NRRL Y-8276) TaxID=1071382 RepID=H2B138_KAZAF|nr:hypothetical protein KAFR_0J02740 [Kazachstania africana CBS 2517]CCF60338.1 hypothetical protein KAFR_0J02740 [Kazachstania africana CBS 2517]
MKRELLKCMSKIRVLRALEHSVSCRNYSAVYRPPNLHDLPRRWLTLDYDTKDEIREYLSWQMEEQWPVMSRDEMKAAYFVNYEDPQTAQQTTGPFPYLFMRLLFNITLVGTVTLSLIEYKNDRRRFTS